MYDDLMNECDKLTIDLFKLIIVNIRYNKDRIEVMQNII